METRLDEPVESPAVPEIEGPWPATPRETLERRLREERLRTRLEAFLRAGRKEENGEESDRYEPQRLTRKICWLYDGNARKVPLLRRNYI